MTPMRQHQGINGGVSLIGVRLQFPLPIDTAVAQRCAALHVPDPRPAMDSLIAATALVHGMTLVTRNVADFQSTGVAILNPWEAP